MDQFNSPYHYQRTIEDFLQQAAANLPSKVWIDFDLVRPISGKLQEWRTHAGSQSSTLSWGVPQANMAKGLLCNTAR